MIVKFDAKGLIELIEIAEHKRCDSLVVRIAPEGVLVTEPPSAGPCPCWEAAKGLWHEDPGFKRRMASVRRLAGDAPLAMVCPMPWFRAAVANGAEVALFEIGEDEFGFVPNAPTAKLRDEAWTCVDPVRLEELFENEDHGVRMFAFRSSEFSLPLVRRAALDRDSLVRDAAIQTIEELPVESLARFLAEDPVPFPDDVQDAIDRKLAGLSSLEKLEFEIALSEIVGRADAGTGI